MSLIFTSRQLLFSSILISSWPLATQHGHMLRNLASERVRGGETAILGFHEYCLRARAQNNEPLGLWKLVFQNPIWWVMIYVWHIDASKYRTKKSWHPKQKIIHWDIRCSRLWWPKRGSATSTTAMGHFHFVFSHSNSMPVNVYAMRRAKYDCVSTDMYLYYTKNKGNSTQTH